MEFRGPPVLTIVAEWSLRSSSQIRADELTIAIASEEVEDQTASSLPQTLLGGLRPLDISLLSWQGQELSI